MPPDCLKKYLLQHYPIFWPFLSLQRAGSKDLTIIKIKGSRGIAPSGSFYVREVIRTPDLPLRSAIRLLAFMSFRRLKTLVSMRMFSIERLDTFRDINYREAVNREAVLSTHFVWQPRS